MAVRWCGYDVGVLHLHSSPLPPPSPRGRGGQVRQPGGPGQGTGGGAAGAEFTQMDINIHNVRRRHPVVPGMQMVISTKKGTRRVAGAFSKYCVDIDVNQSWLTLWTEDGEEQRVAAEQEMVSPSSPSPDRRKSFSMSRSSTVETAETILRWSDALLNTVSPAGLEVPPTRAKVKKVGEKT